MISRILMRGERVVPVECWDDYYITSYGRVISGKRKFKYKTYDGTITTVTKFRELTQFDVRGYKRVSLYKDNKKKDFYVHDLVIAAFKGLADKRVYKVIHKNHNKTDNRIENLEYTSRKIEEYEYEYNFNK